MDSSLTSVSTWLEDLQGGDQQAAEKLWKRYYSQLVALARTKLGSTPRRVADEEDVAAAAFESFFRGVQQGRYPQLADRDDLWRLLFTITERKALDQVASQRRQKRGGGAVRGDSALIAPGQSPDEASGFGGVASPEPTPAFAAEVADRVRQLLEALEDPELRRIAQWKMEGYSNPEIAAQLKCSKSTVDRRLQLIRAIWGQFTQDASV